jgi:hypothetical protein
LKANEENRCLRGLLEHRLPPSLSAGAVVLKEVM